MVGKKATQVCLPFYTKQLLNSIRRNHFERCNFILQRVGRHTLVHKPHLRELSESKFKRTWSKSLMRFWSLSWNEMQFRKPRFSQRWVRSRINLDKYPCVSYLVNLESPHFPNNCVASFKTYNSNSFHLSLSYELWHVHTMLEQDCKQVDLSEIQTQNESCCYRRNNISCLTFDMMSDRLRQS